MGILGEEGPGYVSARVLRLQAKDPIIVELLGGLGNQMFQYAAAFTLAKRANAALLLDLRAFENYKLRKYELHRLSVGARMASIAELRRFPLWGRTVARRLPLFPPCNRYYIEPEMSYDRDFFKVKPGSHLTGYFQSEQYFLERKSEIKAQFQPSMQANREVASLLRFIGQHATVSVHVRRGDYISDPAASSFHGACGTEYYRKAFGLIEASSPNSQFLVFSDDIEWSRRNITPPGKTIYVDGNGDSPEMDIFLMSRCAHSICANSSFSWWGAWLNDNHEKIVIVPDRWYADPGIRNDDLIPGNWLRI